MVGTYTAQAQTFTGFDGTWLKLTIKPQRGLEFTGYDSTSAPAKMRASALNAYACIDVDENAPNPAYLRFYNRSGTAVGNGVLYWDAGTNLEFLGYLEASLATNVAYVPGDDGFPTDSTLTDTYVYGYVSVKGKTVDKIKIQSVSGEGYIQSPGATATQGTYAGFGYVLNGGSTKDKNIPTITPACGAIIFPTP